MLSCWVGHWVIGSWQLNESYLNFQNSLPFFVTSKRNIYMFSFMFCCEFSNIGNTQHTLYQRYKHPSLSFSIFSSKLLILHEFKLFLILYAKCKCNITTSKEDKPPYQHNTRHTMHRRTIITPPSPCHLVMMNECQLVEVLHLRMPILPIHISFCVLHFRGYKRLKCNKLHPN